MKCNRCEQYPCRCTDSVDVVAEHYARQPGSGWLFAAFVACAWGHPTIGALCILVYYVRQP